MIVALCLAVPGPAITTNHSQPPLILIRHVQHGKVELLDYSVLLCRANQEIHRLHDAMACWLQTHNGTQWHDSVSYIYRPTLRDWRTSFQPFLRAAKTTHECYQQRLSTRD
ncbi:hypothetical protein BaRGS_00010706 [Batillaria attramentaria]|uniref:Uncharacterized protein n=1 Tax=Batillaria attramentaria TaxID=370345 RepID=A0ABD0LFU5_9CAEN